MSTISLPAHGWLMPGAHLQFKWAGQGRNFATNPGGAIHAPGAGQVLSVRAGKPFPAGLGPRYPIVRIDTGPWAGRTYYFGAVTCTLREGQLFSFGEQIAVADQGMNWAGTSGAWVEFGDAFDSGAGYLPAPRAEHHWFDRLIATPLVYKLATQRPQLGDHGAQVLEMTHRLAQCGYLPHRRFTFDEAALHALEEFRRAHLLQRAHIYDDRTELTLLHATARCRAMNRKEM